VCRVARFFLLKYIKPLRNAPVDNNIQNGRKIYQIYFISRKYTKWPYVQYTKYPENIPNTQKIHPMAIKYTKVVQPFGLQQYTKIGIFGMQVYHLATLHVWSSKKVSSYLRLLLDFFSPQNLEKFRPR
jgi:hypothetical protein